MTLNCLPSGHGERLQGSLSRLNSWLGLQLDALCSMCKIGLPSLHDGPLTPFSLHNSSPVMQLKLVPSHFFRPHPAMTKRLLVLRFPVPHVAVHPVHGVQSDSRHLGQSINYQYMGLSKNDVKIINPIYIFIPRRFGFVSSKF